MEPSQPRLTEDQIKALIEPLADLLVEQRTHRLATTVQVLFTALLGALRERGALEQRDIERMLEKLDAQGAAMARLATDTSASVADAALLLRHALVMKAEQKHS